MARIVPAGPAERLRDVVRLRRRPARLRGRRSWRPRIGRFVDRAGAWLRGGGRTARHRRRRAGAVSVYAGMEPEAAAKAIWKRIEAIRYKEAER